jgi:hypothetical protein
VRTGKSASSTDQPFHRVLPDAEGGFGQDAPLGVRDEEDHGRHVAQMHGRGNEPPLLLGVVAATQQTLFQQEKEYYGQLTEVENEKRRRDHVLDMRDRAIADWEENEARRKGLLASTTLEASSDYFRGLLLEVRHMHLPLLCFVCVHRWLCGANVMPSITCAPPELHERAA